MHTAQWDRGALEALRSPWGSEAQRTRCTRLGCPRTAWARAARTRRRPSGCGAGTRGRRPRAQPPAPRRRRGHGPQQARAEQGHAHLVGLLEELARVARRSLAEARWWRSHGGRAAQGAYVCAHSTEQRRRRARTKVLRLHALGGLQGVDDQREAAQLQLAVDDVLGEYEGWRERRGPQAIDGGDPPSTKPPPSPPAPCENRSKLKPAAPDAASAAWTKRRSASSGVGGSEACADLQRQGETLGPRAPQRGSEAPHLVHHEEAVATGPRTPHALRPLTSCTMREALSATGSRPARGRRRQREAPRARAAGRCGRRALPPPQTQGERRASARLGGCEVHRDVQLGGGRRGGAGLVRDLWFN